MIPEVVPLAGTLKLLLDIRSFLVALLPCDQSPSFLSITVLAFLACDGL
jgi:hypothetical protein